MDSDANNAQNREPLSQSEEKPTFCWKEMLDRAFTGWEPADQALERLIDRAERRS